MYRLDPQHHQVLSQLHRPNLTGTSRTLLLKIRYQVSRMSHALVVPHSQQATYLELSGLCNSTDGVLHIPRQGARFRL